MAAARPKWRRLAFSLPREGADSAVGWLVSRLEVGVEETSDGDRTTLAVYLSRESATADASALAKSLEEFLTELGIEGEVRVESRDEIEEEDWPALWRRYAAPIRVGPRVVVVPSGQQVPEVEDPVVVHLDPGLAFGSGAHASTQLALRMLEQELAPGMTVADIGCGSGILSVAAALLGASRVVAVDTDPQAVVSTAQNAERNAVGHVVEAREGCGVPEPPPMGFDVIVANITPSVIADLIPQVERALAPDGVFLASGIPEVRRDELSAPIEASRTLAACRTEEQEGWCGLVLRARSHG